MKHRTLLVSVFMAVFTLAATGLTASASATASATLTRAHLVIGYSQFGCHTWALNTGKAQATHHVVLHAYESLTVWNGDFADHTLVQTAGPAEAQLSSLATGTSSNGMLRHYSGTTKVAFQTPGIYKFITVESPHRLLGPFGPTDDHVLTLTVHVLPGHIQ